MAFALFILVEFYIVYRSPYLFLPSASSYVLYAIGYAVGAVLLASVARGCAELQEASWQARRLLLVIGIGGTTFVVALYVLWLLPLPTHVALTADEWGHAKVVLRPDPLSRLSARVTGRLPALFQESAFLQIGAKSLNMFDFVFSEAAHSIELRTAQPQSIVICWPEWLEIKQPQGNVSNDDGKTCLAETVSHNITIRGDVVGMRASLKKSQDQQNDALFVPSNLSIALRQQSHEGGLIIETPGGTTLSTDANRFSSLEVEIDRFGARKFLSWGHMMRRELEEIMEYQASVVISIDDEEELRLLDTMDISRVSILGDEGVTYDFPEANDKKGNIRINSTLEGVLDLSHANSLYLGVDISTFAVTGAKGRVKNGDVIIEVDRLDEVFLGGSDLYMKLARSGGIEAYGEATHVVVNGRVMWRAMGHFVPSEVWAAIIGAAVSFGLSVAMLRGRSLLRDSER